MVKRTLTTTALDRRVVTAREAQDMLGVPASTIRAWASRQRLFAVSIDADGSRWYLLADVLALHDGTFRRSRHARPARCIRQDP